MNWGSSSPLYREVTPPKAKWKNNTKETNENPLFANLFSYGGVGLMLFFGHERSTIKVA